MPAGNLSAFVSQLDEYTVSILVLVDACRKQPGALRVTFRIEVSILVLVDACRKQDIEERLPASRKVSILVLVDACRKQLLASPAGAPRSSFNPCSRGCLPETWYSRSALAVWSRFQSLFSWMPAGNRPTPFPPCKPTSGFNPCSRGCLPETRITCELMERRPSFNPCSRGCLPETWIQRGVLRRFYVSILVLVDACRKPSAISRTC